MLHKSALILVCLLAPFVVHGDAHSRYFSDAEIVAHALPDVQHIAFSDVFSADYPIVKTGNQSVDSLILAHSIVVVFGNDCVGMSLDDAYLKWSDSTGLVWHYEAVYNKSPYVSLRIDCEWLAAYSTQWSTYLNFSTATGELLTIHSLLDSNESFSQIISNEYSRQLQEYKKELVGVFAEDNGYSDEEATKDVSELLESYENELRFIGFSITEKGLVLRYGVFFPHYLKCYDKDIVIEITREEYPQYFL